MVRNQESNKDLAGGRMIEKIRTFFGRVLGLHEKKRTIVVIGSAWTCTKCKLIFLTKREGDNHDCAEIYGNGL